MLSREVWVMLHPRQAFVQPADLATTPVAPWLYWRRPLLLLLILCTTISLLTTGGFSLHVVGSTAVYWSILPLAEIAGLAAVERRWPRSSTVDRFFMGHGPWLLFLIAFAAYCSSPAGVVLPPPIFYTWAAAAAAVLLWSLWIDYRFFGSLGRLALHRAVSWTLMAAVFAGTWLWVEL